MSSATQTATTAAQSVGRLKLRLSKEDEADYAEQLRARGYVVVKNVLSAAQAAAYVDKAWTWLEGFGLGFDRHDRSTWHARNVPPFRRGGMFAGMGVAQEDWVWALRSEPQLVEAFAHVWGTDELLTSFDGINISVPLPTDELPDGAAPWPHTDQSPLTQRLHCIQGIINLLPNGPEDGGLMVLEGSFQLFNQFFDEHEADKPADGWSPKDVYVFTSEQMKWFEARGCVWTHVNSEPGDLMLWDSRTVHYGAAPSSSNPRMAAYVCYKPAALITPEQLALKKEAYETSVTTSHDPVTFRLMPQPESDLLRKKPLQKAQLDARQRRLAGIEQY